MGQIDQTIKEIYETPVDHFTALLLLFNFLDWQKQQLLEEK